MYAALPVMPVYQVQDGRRAQPILLLWRHPCLAQRFLRTRRCIWIDEDPASPGRGAVNSVHMTTVWLFFPESLLYRPSRLH